MNGPMVEKITASHLKRDAYLYIRQSTLRQVLENTESTRRQYELQHRAVALGWPAERVVVIDSDLGQSGASAADRKGFQKLVTEVSLGRAGLVMGLEVSRLARNCSDWHRLLEICALGDTLILDEDGLYNPADFNDRLLLGLKGTMSEAELHVLKARLRGGILNKARRGELRTPLPVGLVYNSKDQVELDPDQQVQKSLRLFFETFRRTGSATTTVKAFREQGLLFPRRLCRGLRKGELLWGRLDHWRALQLLHNPRYGGTFFFGRTRQRKRADGSVFCRKLPQAAARSVVCAVSAFPSRLHQLGGVPGEPAPTARKPVRRAGARSGPLRAARLGRSRHAQPEKGPGRAAAGRVPPSGHSGSGLPAGLAL